MRFLLDTHIAVWAIGKSARLSAAARELIGDERHEVVVSVVSLWEISIKFALAEKRGSGIDFSGRDALGYFREAGYALLPVTPEHAAAVDDLPALHRDPFDRLLIAQALHEPLRLMTHDKRVAAYSPHFILV